MNQARENNVAEEFSATSYESADGRVFRCDANVDALHAELAEIDENLIRRNLDSIDEGNKLLRRKQIYEALHP